MFPAFGRGRALDLCLFAACMFVSACASTGPGTAPPLFPRSDAFPTGGMAVGPLTPSGAAESAVMGMMAPAKPAGAKPLARTRRVSSSASATRDTAVQKAAKPKTDAKPTRRVKQPAPKTRADSAAVERAITKRLAHRPLAQALDRRIRNPELADRVASAVVYEAGRARLMPSVLAAVLLIENAPFDTSAVSTEGAIGLMQVMPVHVGSYRCLSGDLVNVEANICHGARLLSSYLRRTKSLDAALRRYNGCVRGRNTPRCHRYPLRVMRTASRLQREILVVAASYPEANPDGEEVASSQLGAAVPHEVERDSTVDTPSQPDPCSTLLGCLRKRWTSTRLPPRQPPTSALNAPR